ncbi:alcohol dehydrogenase transcription factor myb/SANT-like domain-containing protein [Phthorimaea operculella]|nr:alcohol dehydrogenase transcription factor myb/SANT-like domain-containing protein [Phthorimaea operculella]
MCEPQDLIMAIEKYPCIWNIHDQDYHNRDVKDLAWEQVCKEVFRDWDNCTDKPKKCAELKKKWQNIKDYYKKEIQKEKNTPSGSAATKRPKYVYGEMLNFLLPMLAKRHTEGNYADSERTESLESQGEEQEDMNNLERSVRVPTPPEPDQSAPKPRGNKKKKDVPTQILDILQERQKEKQKTTNNETEDDDTKFLLSFRGYMKKMTSDQKFTFQVGMLELVKKILTESSSSPPPSDSNSPTYYNVTSPSWHHSSASSSLQSSSSPRYFNFTSPPATYVPSRQRSSSSASHSQHFSNLPRYHKVSAPSSTFVPSQRNVTGGGNASNLVIRQVTNTPSLQSSTRQSPLQIQYLQDDSVQEYVTIENEETAQAEYIIQTQDEDTQDESITKYLKFK